jgi:hypothetical protein
VKGPPGTDCLVEMPQRRFPPPWSVEETEACFIVRDGNELSERGTLPFSKGDLLSFLLKFLYITFNIKP